MRLKAGLAAAAALGLLPAPAHAQTLQEIERREAELVAAWEQTPLLFRKAIFVPEKPAQYGAYTQRPSNRFRPGEPLLIYLEPVGYGWQRQGESFAFGVELDVLLKAKGGKVVGEQKKFLVSKMVSRHRLRELMLNVTLTLNDVPSGEYVVELVARESTGKSGTVAMPFTIAK